MATAYHHAVSSAKKFGGSPQDYQAIHDWIDGSKAHFGDFRHRALRHHTLGVFDAEQVFGTFIKNSDHKLVTVRQIAEQHVIEDMGSLVTVQDWLAELKPQPWMNRPQKLSRAVQDAARREPDPVEPPRMTLASPLEELLADNLRAWEGEEDSVQEEHKELIDRLRVAGIGTPRYEVIPAQSTTCRQCGQQPRLLCSTDDNMLHKPAFYLCSCGFVGHIGVGPVPETK